MPILKNQYEACLKQIGTLGGGNHFIEIQKDTETSDVWVMIHSGSRNIGLKVANHYNKIAQYWNEKWYSENGIGTSLPANGDTDGKGLFP